MILYEGGYAYVDGYKFRKDVESGYYLSTKKIGNARMRLHRYIWISRHGPIPEGYEIHHKDKNKDNNDVDNLELLLIKDHKKWHNENMSEETLTKTSRNLDNIRHKAIEWHKSEEGRAWHSQMAKDAYKKRKPVQSNCEYCGKKYSSLKRAGMKFCSPKCRTAYRYHNGLDDEIRECVICHNEFSINKYRKNKTCSRDCGAKLRKQNASHS